MENRQKRRKEEKDLRRRRQKVYGSVKGAGHKSREVLMEKKCFFSERKRANIYRRERQEHNKHNNKK